MKSFACRSNPTGEVDSTSTAGGDAKGGAAGGGGECNKDGHRLDGDELCWRSLYKDEGGNVQEKKRGGNVQETNMLIMLIYLLTHVIQYKSTWIFSFLSSSIQLYHTSGDYDPHSDTYMTLTLGKSSFRFNVMVSIILTYVYIPVSGIS